MAEARVSVNLEEFSCPICLYLLNDPVSVPCGHSFCKSCINTQWDGEVRSRVFTCPVCKSRFNPRPILGRNIMLAEMVEKLRRTRVPERTLAGTDDVECDVCVGRKYKAVKSCLVCFASYCEVHFNLHNELNPGNTHKVTEPRYNLRDRLCSQHNQPKEFFCYMEDEFMCSKCLDVCRCSGHNTITVKNQRRQQQREIGDIQTQVQQRTRAAENNLKDLKKAVQSIKTSAKTTLVQSEKIFEELIRSAERKRSEIREIIKAAERAEMQRAEEILKRIEQEMVKLKKRDHELVQLPQIDDDFLFVRTFRSLMDFSSFEDDTHITVDLSPLTEIQNSVSELAIKVKELCRTGLHTNRSVNRCHVVQTSAPILREDFLQHFRQLTVDPSTAQAYLQLSEGDRRITFDDTKPTHDLSCCEFVYHAQALCRGPLQERCYWEVEWGGQQVYIAASYRDIMRSSGLDGGFGHNNRSWSLCCNASRFLFFHDDHKRVISGPVSTRIGVYLDHRAGSLSFYSITDTMTLLHRVRTTFTEPLYAAFWVFDDSSVKVCGKNENLPLHTRPTVRERLIGDQFIFVSSLEYYYGKV